jgi:hypothetical protein
MNVNEELALVKAAMQVVVKVQGLTFKATKGQAIKMLFTDANSKWTIEGMRDGTLTLVHPEIS